jgi:hypothetical protein
MALQSKQPNILHRANTREWRWGAPSEFLFSFSFGKKKAENESGGFQGNSENRFPQKTVLRSNERMKKQIPRKTVFGVYILIANERKLIIEILVLKRIFIGPFHTYLSPTLRMQLSRFDYPFPFDEVWYGPIQIYLEPSNAIIW